MDIIQCKNINKQIEDDNKNDSTSNIPGRKGKVYYDDKQILEFVLDQFNFYTSMCNSRNFTWKKFVENACNFDSLVTSSLDPKYSFEIRSIICNLLNKLYVD